MAALLFALLAALMATVGGRDQRLVAHLSASLGASLPLLAICWLVSAMTAALAALAGQWLALPLPDAARAWAAVLVLVVAAVELAWPVRERPAREPTRSLFAIGLVLLLRQIADAPRLAVAAIALASGLPLQAAMGGALGSGAALTLGWIGWAAAGPVDRHRSRSGVAGLLLIAAAWAAFSA